MVSTDPSLLSNVGTEMVQLQSFIDPALLESSDGTAKSIGLNGSAG